MSEHDEILLECADQQPDVWVLHFCPFCRAEHENKLATKVTPEGIVYSCWRAKCGAKGFIRSSMDASWVHSQTSAPKFTPKPYYGLTGCIPHEVLETLEERYELTEDILVQNLVTYSPKYHELVLPVFDVGGQRTAVYTKKIEKPADGRKTFLFTERPGPYYHIPSIEFSDTLVVVEDPLSAMKLGAFTAAVALLGTSLNQEVALALRQRWSNLVIMLDNDATNKAYEMAKNWGALFHTRVVPMIKDPKDTPAAELKELL